ncbi:acyl-CoA N-acyltransferase [Mycena floridula]|nr:acyl-CoA N-acyltransferase [Mycena floridula]
MPDRPRHEIIIASTESEIKQCYRVRIEVFVNEQGFAEETEIDDIDNDQSPSSAVTHFLLRKITETEDGKLDYSPIGTIRGWKTAQDYYKLTRLAVLSSYRQHKFGRDLVLALHDWVRKHARASSPDIMDVKIVAHSQMPVKGFYAKFGYVAEGAWTL